MNTRRTWPLVAVAALVAAAASAPASGNPAPESDEVAQMIERLGQEFSVTARRSDERGVLKIDPDIGQREPLDAETLEDLQQHSRDEDLSYQRLVAAHQGIHEFSTLATRLEQSDSDTFVRSGLDTDNPGTYWLSFTERPGDDVVSRIAEVAVPVTLEYGKSASAEELSNLSDRLVSVLGSRPDVVEWASAGYDPDTDVLRVEFAQLDGVMATILELVLRSALESISKDGELPIEVVFSPTDDPPPVDEVTVKGGLALNDRFTNSRELCTAGFTAKRGSFRGVLTAEHCINQLRLLSTPNALSQNPAEPNYDAIDIQFHGTLRGNGHGTNKQFRATGSQDFRKVKRVAVSPQGSTVCNWGRVTGYKCTRVVDQDRCAVISGQRRCGLDYTPRDVTSGGDSGGPWFLGATARGIHQGGGTQSKFTRINRARFVGARILQAAN